jgi:hypothetical protein
VAVVALLREAVDQVESGMPELAAYRHWSRARAAGFEPATFGLEG